MPERGAVLQWLLIMCCVLPCLQSLDSEMARKRRHWSDKEHEIPDEQRLLTALLKGYHEYSRPVFNASDKVTIKFGLTLVQISDMDEVNQVLTINVWLEQEWEDERLTWDPKDYNGLEILRIPCEKLWLPDIVLYNSADDFTTGYMKSKAMVRSNGNVFWPPPAKFRSSCKIDITYFPFDDQVCELKFGSWTYDGFQVDVTNRSATVDLENYVFSGEWELIDVQIRRTEVFYACCAEPYPDVRFTIIIRRKTLYYLFNIIFPCLWLTILSLLGFWLPPDSGEKITLGITVLLAFSVFMLLIAESMPATSEFVPLIGIYLTVTMAMTSMSIILTVFVLQLHHVGPHQKRVPRWMWTLVIEVLAPVVCLCHVSQRYKYVGLQKAARRDSKREQKRQQQLQGASGEGGEAEIRLNTLSPGDQTNSEVTVEGGGVGRVRRNCNGIIVGGGVDAGDVGRGRGGVNGGINDVQGGIGGLDDGLGPSLVLSHRDQQRRGVAGRVDVERGSFVRGSDFEGESDGVGGGDVGRVSMNTSGSESGMGSEFNSGVGGSAGMSSTRTSVSLRQPPAGRDGKHFSSKGSARRDPVSRPGEYITSVRNSRGSHSSQPKTDRRSCDSKAFGQQNYHHGVVESALGTSRMSSVTSEADSHSETGRKLNELGDGGTAIWTPTDASPCREDPLPHEEKLSQPRSAPDMQDRDRLHQPKRDSRYTHVKDPVYQKSVDAQYSQRVDLSHYQVPDTYNRQQQGTYYQDRADDQHQYHQGTERNQRGDHYHYSYEQNRDSHYPDTRRYFHGQVPPGYQSRSSSTHRASTRHRGGSTRQRDNEQIHQHLQVLVTRDDDSDYHQDVVTEWRVVAHVMDRLLFWLFLIVAVASSVVILIVKPLTKPEPWRNVPNATYHR